MHILPVYLCMFFRVLTYLLTVKKHADRQMGYAKLFLRVNVCMLSYDELVSM